MSKIGKMPINIQDGILVRIDKREIVVSGPKGELKHLLPEGLKVESEEGRLLVKKENPSVQDAMFGLTRSLLANMVKGVEAGFEKKLELSGVGYRAQMQGSDLLLSLGFAHPVKYTPITGVKITVADNVISVIGIDKALVGQEAAKIRSLRPPEPYKGKGIRYAGERIRRKAGKAAKAVGGK